MQPPPTWAEARRMILPGAYAMLRRWPKVTALSAIVIGALVLGAYAIENLTESAWGGYLMWLAWYAGIFTATGLILAATISLARSRSEDIGPVADPPATFRALAIMAATTVPVAFLATELDIAAVAAAETVMLVLFVATAITALAPRRAHPSL